MAKTKGTRRDVEKEGRWRKIIARQARSGGGIRGFCQREGVDEGQFYAWRRELRLRDLEGNGNGVFVPVKLREREDAESSPWAVEIEIGEVIRVRMKSGVDEGTVGMVMKALGSE